MTDLRPIHNTKNAATSDQRQACDMLRDLRDLSLVVAGPETQKLSRAQLSTTSITVAGVVAMARSFQPIADQIL